MSATCQKRSVTIELFAFFKIPFDYVSFAAGQDIISHYVPPQETVGPHTYYVHVEGVEEEQTPQNVTWNSQPSTIQVYTEAEATYVQLLPQVTNKIAEAQKANYQNADAKSLLQNATEEYNQATSLANQSQWQAATTDLQNASNLLDNASEKEQTFVSQQTFIEEALATISTVIITSTIVVILVKRRKNRQQGQITSEQFT